MQFPGVVEAPILVLAALCHVRRRDGELGCDLVERVLRVGQPKLALEEGGLGRVLVGIGQVQALGRIKQLLCLLHKAR